MTLFLVNKGVPYDIAECWSDVDRYAAYIILYELTAPIPVEFDFDKGKFVQA